jgi:hypothetical protein
MPWKGVEELEMLRRTLSETGIVHVFDGVKGDAARKT